MAKTKRDELIVGLDIGTTKIAAIVGEVTDGGIDVIGIGTAPSRGLRKGVVVNIESTVQSIQRAIEEAQLMAGCRIHSAFVGVAGNHIRSLNSHGIVAIRDREVSSADRRCNAYENDCSKKPSGTMLHRCGAGDRHLLCPGFTAASAQAVAPAAALPGWEGQPQQGRPAPAGKARGGESRF